MNDQINALKDDVAFMRALAQEGRSAPLLGGATMVAAGVIYTGATLVSWAIAAGLIAAPATWLSGVWVVATAIYLAVLSLLVSRWRRIGQPGSSATSNRAFRWAWTAGGCALGSIFAGAILAAHRLHSDLVFAIFPTIVLSIYGAAWTLTSVMSSRRWVRWVAAGCFAAAIGLAVLNTASQIYLAFAAALMLLMTAPGIALMRQEPARDLGQKSAKTA